jgi:uncharacterized membrane protein YdbT with pleckstrin-like domain
MPNRPNTRYDLNAEQAITKIKPVAFLGAFCQSGLLFCLILPWIWSYLKLKNTTYFLTTHRLRIRQGVWNRKTQEIELFRFQDISIERPFLFRFTPLGYINVYTNDINERWVLLEAVPNYEQIAETIRRIATLRQLEVPPTWISGGS